MGNIFKGILYTSLAGIIGAGGYMLGKYKHMGGKVSLTMVGLALVLYAPKGCDVLETYIKVHGEVEKSKIYGTARKDSLDAIINSEKRRDSTLYLKQFIQNASNTAEQLEDKYKEIIKDNENRYNNLLQKNDAQYDKVLGGMIQQNEVLKNDLEKLKTTTVQPNIKPYVTSSPNINAGKLVSVKNTAEGLIEDRVLPDGTKFVVLYKK
jgi:hypothetical protein